VRGEAWKMWAKPARPLNEIEVHPVLPLTLAPEAQAAQEGQGRHYFIELLGK
jgi:hypothetical protein